VTFRVQSYFILNASPASPIYYNVDRVRDGRSYVTRAVRAVQGGRANFILICSYQRPEPWQPSYQSPMPPNLPSPEECTDDAVLYRERAAATKREYLKNIWTRELRCSRRFMYGPWLTQSTIVSGQEPDSHTVCRGPLRGGRTRLLYVDEGEAPPRMRPRLPEDSDRVRGVVCVAFPHDFP